METNQLIQELQTFLTEQQVTNKGKLEQFNKMNDIVLTLRNEKLNENFDGTVEEIHHYILSGKKKENINEHVEYHREHLIRWMEELSMLKKGGGAVTIDYEQRKGREI